MKQVGDIFTVDAFPCSSKRGRPSGKSKSSKSGAQRQADFRAARKSLIDDLQLTVRSLQDDLQKEKLEHSHTRWCEGIQVQSIR